jgi:uncharacterized membrane protein
MAQPTSAGERETARLEAFSDGVFAIAITILALELRVPHVEDATPSTLAWAVLDQWPSYFAFVLSFATILIMWINHHARMSLVLRVDGLLMFANGVLLLMIAAISFPTALVGEYLTGPAGRTAVVTYALLVLATSAAWNVFMFALKPERNLLKPGVFPAVISAIRRRVALGFAIYAVAVLASLVNAYLGLGLITTMWGQWGSTAYRALNRQRGPRAERVQS